MTKEDSIKATRNGAIAACISGALTLGIMLVAMYGDSSGTLAYWNSPLILFDVAIAFGCAFGIYKKSRAASIFIFIYFIFAKLVTGIETGRVSGIGTALVFLYFYGRAIQGAYVFHKVEKAENPDYKPAPKWLYFTGIPLAILIFVFMGIGLLSVTGVLPSTEVQNGRDLLTRDRDLLVSNGVVSDSDHIEYFYSWGVTSIIEGGAILTRDRVILYLPDENQEIMVYQIFIDDVETIEQIEIGDFFNDSVYRVIAREPENWIQIPLSAENRGDERFIESLRSRLNGPISTP